MKIRKLPSGSYTTQVQVNGVRKSFTAPTKAECRQLAMEYAVRRSETLCEPLGDLIDKYIDSRRNVLSPSTIRGYDQIRQTHISYLADVRVNELTSEILQRYINLLALDHSPKTVRNIYGLISSTLKVFAPGISPDITLPKRKRIQYSIPTTAEVNLLISESSGDLQTAIMLAAFCGLRRSEIAALNSTDVFGHYIHVHAAAVHNSDWQTVIKAPKTYQSDRYVRVPDIIYNHIKDIDGRICPIELSALTKKFIILRNRLNMSCRFHDLRHYYASFQHAIGIPDQDIMQAGGWKSDTVLKSVYRNTLTDERQRNDDKINEFLNVNIRQVQTKCKQTLTKAVSIDNLHGFESRMLQINKPLRDQRKILKRFFFTSMFFKAVQFRYRH